MCGDDAELFHEIFRFLDVDKASRNNIGPRDDASVLARKVHDHDQHAVLRQMLAVTQHDASHVSYARTVDKDLARRNGATPFAGSLRELKDLADVRDKNILRVHTHRLRKPRMRLQMALLAVERNEEARMQQRMHDLEFFLAGMAGDMQALELIVDNVCSLAVELVDDLADGLFVAGDSRGRDDHAVARLNFHLSVPGEGHAVQS